MSHVHRTFSLLLLGLSLLRSAHAQTTSEARAEAAERFDRALRLVNAGDLSGSLAEFQRAQTLVPSPVVLYNIGLVFAALHRPVDAVAALTKALAQVDALTPQNAARARRTLLEQREFIGKVALELDVNQGVVELDGVQVARLPLELPLDVSAGPHVVGVVAPGYAPSRREVFVAGRQTLRVRLELTAIEGVLAHVMVRSRIPAADILVDAGRVGKTPLDATIAVQAGAHRVEVKRAGYVTQSRSINLQSGARAELSLNPSIDPAALAAEGGYLDVRASETQALVGIDGEEPSLLRGVLHVPKGPHRLRVVRGGFLPAERDVNVAFAKTTEISVALEPTPETRAHYVEAAERRRVWSLATLGVGVAMAGAGVALALVEQGRLPSAESELDQASADAEAGSGRPCDARTLILSDAQRQACEQRLATSSDRVNDLRTLRTVGWIGGAVGGAVALTGLTLLLTGDDPHRYDEKSAHGLGGWRLAPQVGLGSLFVAGTHAF